MIEKNDHATSASVAEYFYDYRNRLVEVLTGGDNVDHFYTYDPFDQLVAMDSEGDTTTDYVTPEHQAFVYDGGQMVMHFQSGGPGDDTSPLGFDQLYERNLYGPAVDMLLAQDDGSVGSLAFWPLPDYHNSNVDSVVKIGSTIYQGFADSDCASNDKAECCSLHRSLQPKGFRVSAR